VLKKLLVVDSPLALLERSMPRAGGDCVGASFVAS
jgi:hypothetical protein